MRIIGLCKRRPQGRDLFTRPYGRFYHLIQTLATYGHDVHLLLLSYRNDLEEDRREGNLQCCSVSMLPWDAFAYVRKANEIAGVLRPHWVIGFSDIWYGILAQRLAEQYRCRSLIDAYDNYESYIPWLKPLHWLWRKAVARADVVTAAGPQLANLLARQRPNGPTSIVPMAADPSFYPRDRNQCRDHFGLPPDKKLIGYFGALYKNRGIEVLLKAFSELRCDNPQVELVLSGRMDRERTLPEGCRWLGYLPDEEVALLLCAMDTVAVMNRASAFGTYSYPAKLYEAMRCGIPVVATDTDAARWILEGREACLARSGNVTDLRKKLLDSLDVGARDYGRQLSWDDCAAEFENILLNAGALHGRPRTIDS